MNNSEKALSCFRDSFNCSQAILSTYGPIFGVDHDTCLKIACPFGAGMGRMQEVCGAVSGAFMVIGLKYGRYQLEDTESKDNTYGLVREFAGRFIKLHGSISCSTLLGCDITTDEGMQEAKEKNIFVEKCEKYVRDSAEILEEML